MRTGDDHKPRPPQFRNVLKEITDAPLLQEANCPSTRSRHQFQCWCRAARHHGKLCESRANAAKAKHNVFESELLNPPEALMSNTFLL